MKGTSPALLLLLRSQTQSELLALLFLNPDDEYSLTEVARRTGASLPSIHTEVTRLVGAGLVRDRRVGNVRLVAADLSSVLAGPLTDLLAAGHGPGPVVAGALAGIAGVDEAYLIGDWAERHAGTAEPASVVDVLVVGSAAADALSSAGAAASDLLQRDVNLRQVPADEWRRARAGERSSALLTELAGGPRVPLVGPEAHVTRRTALEPEPVGSESGAPVAASALSDTADERARAAAEDPSVPRSAGDGCPLLAIAPAIVAGVARAGSSLPLAAPMGAACSAFSSAITLRWLPWDSLPLRLCSSLPTVSRTGR